MSSTGKAHSGRRHRATARTVTKDSNKVPSDDGIKKKTKHRLYSSGSGGRSDGHAKKTTTTKTVPSDATKEKSSSKSTAAQRRNKIWWYQNSSRLPTSSNTLKKELCQLFNIMKDAGMLRTDDELEDPTKKPRVSSSLTVSSKKAKAKGAPIVEGFSISKEALQNVHQLLTHYMGEILKTAQTICQNGQKMTVRPDILDLSLILTNKQMGPKWNMQLEAVASTD